MTATVTADFKEEFEAEGAKRLRRRFLWYCGVSLFLGFLGEISVVLMLALAPDEAQVEAWLIAVVSTLAIVPYVWVMVHAWRNRAIKRTQLIRIVYWLLVAIGIVNLLMAPFSQRVSQSIANDQRDKIRAQIAENTSPVEVAGEADSGEISMADQGAATEAAGTDEETAGEATESAEPDVIASNGKVIVAERDLPGGGQAQFTVGQTQMGIGLMWMLNLFFSHLFAALFIPWTPREAIRPLIPLLVLNALGLIAFKLFNDAESWLTLAVVITLSPLVGVPGFMICWWRHSSHRKKFHYKMLRGRYGEIKQEFSEAQKIHEALFPVRIEDGPIRLDYIYEPMRQIGGDFLFSRLTTRDDGSIVLHAVLVDVTGHGLTAALTVNRIAGEIEREFGEDPDSSPASLLTGLNNYIHHTLALHSVYATALAVRIDSREQTVRWASAGHPPAFLRAVDGTIERLESTALVLGACLGDDFVVEELSHKFGTGDALLVYTDGATEARNREGVMIGVRGIESIMANGRPDEFGGWASTVMRHVTEHRSGPTEDDTLLVEIYRPISV